tara:strand:- start:345 stop:1319 length:975 start_codon:yes stop_codon:yes gene_type:complete
MKNWLKNLKKIVCGFYLIIFSKNSSQSYQNYLITNPFTALIRMSENLIGLNELNKKKIYGKIWICTGAPKSGTTSLSNLLAIIHKHEYKKSVGRLYHHGMLENENSNLTIDILSRFPDGGVLKYHPILNSNNILTISRLKCKLFVITRHPGDQLTAFLNDHRYKYSNNINLHNNNYFLDHNFPININIKEGNFNDGLEKLINNGYLMSSIIFLNEWIKYSKTEKNAHILKFEDYLKNPKKFIENLCMSLNIEKNSDELIKRLEENSKIKYLSIGENPSNFIASKDKYFSEKNKESYKKILENFEKVYNFSELKNLYPDLISFNK